LTNGIYKSTYFSSSVEIIFLLNNENAKGKFVSCKCTVFLKFFRGGGKTEEEEAGRSSTVLSLG
jgi:hypothetical protein